MCGIVGMAGNLLHKHGAMFRDMLCYDFIRGMHSTGIAFVGHNNQVQTQKELGHPQNLWDYHSDLLSSNGQPKFVQRIMLGHNRHATLGGITYDNAHPFTYGSVTGVHNGSLRQWHKLEGAANFDVDSKALINTIDKKGIEHCWDSFTGAAALVWFDAKTKQLNFIRNDERPLFMATDKDEKVLFWASEYWMITVAAKRAKIELKVSEDSKLPIVSPLPVDTLRTYEVSSTDYKLAEEKKLVKKFQARPNQTTARGNIGRMRDSSTKKGFQINPTWAKDLSKADKDVVGLRCRVENVVTPQVLKPHEYFVVMKAEDGKTVNVYPHSSTEKTFWSSQLGMASYERAIFELCHRPRIQNYVGSSFFIYKIASAGVRLCKNRQNLGELAPKNNENVVPLPQNRVPVIPETTYPGPNGYKVTEKRWRELISQSNGKGCCLGCDEPFQLEEAATIVWRGRGRNLFCQQCGEDDALMKMAEG